MGFEEGGRILHVNDTGAAEAPFPRVEGSYPDSHSDTHKI